MAYLNYFHGSRIQPFCLFLDFVLYSVVDLITHKPKAHNIVLYFCKTKRFFILRTIIEQIRTKTSKDDYLPIPPCHKVLFPLLYHSNLTMITIFNVLMNYIFLITYPFIVIFHFVEHMQGSSYACYMQATYTVTAINSSFTSLFVFFVLMLIKLYKNAACHLLRYQKAQSALSLPYLKIY